MAAAWLDQREPGTLFAAHGVGRPLWLGRGRDEVFFASNRAALEIAAEYTGVRLRVSEVREGTFFALRAGRVARTARFRPDRSYVEETALPAVRAPGESAHCLERLAAIAATRRSRRHAPAPRAVAERGTGTSTTRRDARRTSDRPATPSGEHRPGAAPRPSRRTSVAARAARPGQRLGRRPARASPPPPARRIQPHGARS
jgi:hypothetical protein